nr:inositol polyphosphate multikinase [Helicoverpa armigera]XP_049704450.1 inositol polyphosphate multikinase [Helicoverpa armigera]XP_049704455.1 inositol polyphosphate multikinase [Helicoverpa armigera]XP_049704456.1 inositol polyphosphate multikinase [Helicoverpa armigera]XP_049704459.1 inositol polyphosphate multikinase [Helicoverpa armigera]
MSDVSDKSRRSVRRQRSIYQVHYSIRRQDSEMTARPLALATSPLEVQAYALQVAGHASTQDTKYLGLLQCNNGTIMKPILKEAQKREVDFYERLKSTSDSELRELRTLVPKYFGTRRYCYNGFEQEYIILEDLTQRMLEPCIMDVKIGKRTWDPLATEEKRKNEESKYALCKQQYGFCIPGFQVFRLGSGKMQRYNKDYGKKLQGQAVKDALRNYLNGCGRPLCRALLLQFLSALWRCAGWARRQRAARLYCASLLLVYDAARLRDCCQGDHFTERVNCRQPTAPRRRHSMHSVNAADFSGQLSAKGPVYRKLQSVPLTPMTMSHSSFSPPPPISSPWSDALASFNHNHSFEHNYENKLSKIKMNYRAMLDQLSYDSPTPNPWGTVKIIDFAHAFFNEEDEKEIDENFREGIENLVEIFETFLRETDDQVI